MGLGSIIGTGLGAVGGSFGGPAGAIAGGAIGGGIGGLFDSSGTSPYQSPSFSDINLATENPELYAELMKVSAAADQAQHLYDQRNQGMTALESQQLGASRSNTENSLANHGLLGTSAGLSAQTGAENQVRAQIAQRAFQEQQALAQQAQAAHQGLFQDYMNAQNQVMAPKLQGGMMNFQNQIAQNQGNNQFYGGLINGGLALAGNAYNMNQMSNMKNPYMNSSGGAPMDLNGVQQLNMNSGGFSMPQMGGGYYGNG